MQTRQTQEIISSDFSEVGFVHMTIINIRVAKWSYIIQRISTDKVQINHIYTAKPATYRWTNRK